MREIQIYDDQLKAFLLLSDHIAKGGSDIYKFSGAGGTGKSHTVRHIISFLNTQGLSVIPVAYTGRAAAQLNKDGIRAITLHSLLYNPVFDDKGVLIRWEKKSDRDIIVSCGDGLCVDEASMLPYDMHLILKDLPIPKIYTGDTAQLPSVSPKGEKEFNAMVDVDGDIVTLHKNYRFDENNGIGFLASHLREHDSFPRVSKDCLTYVRKSMVHTVKFHEQNHFDVIVCGMNRTRKAINRLVRRARGYETEIPDIGETVVCLVNTEIIGQGKINNGELFTVEAVFPGKVTSRYIILAEDGKTRYTVNVKNDCWETEKPDRAHGTLPVVCMTFGYCLSCHKVQGSTFRDVLFVDEDVSFFLEQKRFRYTGISRASDSLTVAT